MDSIEQREPDVKERIVQALRKRANVARRNANIALISIFIIIFSGISLFYFAGDIAIQQSTTLAPALRSPPTSSPFLEQD